MKIETKEALREMVEEELLFALIRLAVAFAESENLTVPKLGTHPNMVSEWMDEVLALAGVSKTDEAEDLCLCQAMLEASSEAKEGESIQ